MVLNRHFGMEEDREPREQGLSHSGFRDYTRKTRLVLYEPRELSLCYPRFYPASYSVYVKTGKRDRKKAEKTRAALCCS
jgi:hypothetical protein